MVPSYFVSLGFSLLVLAWVLYDRRRLDAEWRAALADEAVQRRRVGLAHERLVAALGPRRRAAPAAAPFELVRPAQSWADDDYATRRLDAPETFPVLRLDSPAVRP